MARSERRSPVASGPLTNEEASVLIEMILENTNTSAPLVTIVVPDSPQSLTDLFPARRSLVRV